MIISGRHNFLFISVPKSASTTMRRTLSPHSDIVYDSSAHISKLPYSPHITLQEFTTEFHELADFDFFKFTVIRNPIDRLISGFKYKQRPATLNPLHPRHLPAQLRSNSFEYLCFLRDQGFSTTADRQRWGWGSKDYDVVLKLETLEQDLARLPNDCCLKSMLRSSGSLHNKSKFIKTRESVSRKEMEVIEHIVAEEMAHYDTKLPFGGFDKLYSEPDLERGAKVTQLMTENHSDLVVEDLRGRMKRAIASGNLQFVSDSFQELQTKSKTKAMRLLSLYLNALVASGDHKRWEVESAALLYLYPSNIDDFVALARYYRHKKMTEEATLTISIGVRKFPGSKILQKWANEN